MSSKPLFSVITVSFNSSRTIARTLQSVRSQDLSQDEVEHILVDGLSTDDTVQIIERERGANCHCISEKDQGIYDAMNKGVSLSRGEWICFLNSDDEFAASDVLSKVAETIRKHPDAEFVYGKVAQVQDGHVIGQIGMEITPKDYWYPCHCMCHQAIFARRRLFERVGPFELGIPGGIADYIWMARYFNNAHGEVVFMDKVISNFAEDGHSLVHVWPAYMSLLRFSRHFFPWRIRLKFYAMFPKKFLKFKVLRLQEDTALRRFYRRAMRIMKGGKCANC